MSTGEMAEDPRGLIREAFLIDGIGTEEARSIFFDWALSLPDGISAAEAVPKLLQRYGQPGHPMTAVLEEGLAGSAAPKRRGGRGARLGY